MKVTKFETEDAWLEARKGRVTGSSLKDIVVKRGTGQKIGFYKLIADRVAVPRDDENRMDRGHRLEAEAVERLAQETGLPFVQVDNELWTREDNENIAYSPDGYVPSDLITVACEVKCLATEKHLEAYITQKIPSEYIEQTRQAFAVCDTLDILYFVMYDPSVTVDYFHFVVTRSEVAEEVQYLLDYQKDTLALIEEWVDKLTFK